MNIIFRLNYHTVPGQSLWLKYSTILGDHAVRFDQVVPLRWINEQQWEAQVQVSGAGEFIMEYHYQLRYDAGVVMDEWHTPRITKVDLDSHDALLFLDSWCSAGTVDYTFETKALLTVLSARGPFQKRSTPVDANHSFQLRMAAVPLGQVPCLVGSVSEIGNWGWHSAIPLEETIPNVWQKDLYLPLDWHIEYKYGLFDLKLHCVVSIELGENRVLPARVVGERQWTKVEDECYRRDSRSLFRGAGVAMPVFSLRSEKSLGVGEFADLKPFSDWAHGVGLKLIQILPINDTTSSHDWTDSYPYSAISVFALHPLYLRIDHLNYAMPIAFKQELSRERDQLNLLEQVDYEAVMRVKSQLTRQVFEKHGSAIIGDASYKEFLKANGEWVIPYAAFCVKRDHYENADFSTWEEWATFDSEKVNSLMTPTHPDSAEMNYHIWIQYELDIQLSDAVDHLHAHGLALKGDLPIGIDRQSVDAWSSPHLFKMDAQAGAPPDAFAVKGQNWGFPTYNWDVMQLDDYAWWRARFAQLGHYFDAYRIDHILGFFRIWQVPTDQVEGIMGYFDPAIPIHIDEIRAQGIDFDYNRFCRPYIRGHFLRERFGDVVDYVKNHFLHDCGDGYFQLGEQVATQRRIVDYLADHPHDDLIQQGLLDCASEVLFFEVPGSHGTLFHPRCSMRATYSYQELHPDVQWRVDDLYNDYFYRRQEDFWQARGYETLPAMRQASPMLLCGEDLGMVPACVPGVMRELGILSLEIQRMPKTHEIEFFNPANAPYMSVVSPSTHDMPTLRGWWEEDSHTTANFAWQMLGISFPANDLSGEDATQIIRQHLHSPAMWAVFPLQDLLAIDEELRNPQVDSERINIPAIMPFYWRYRMHLTVEQLAAADGFNRRIADLLRFAGR